MKDLRQRIREFRKERGLSYAEFSKRFFEGGVSPQTLKNLETGYVEPRISTLKTVSERLGMDIHEVAHQAFGLDGPEEMGEFNEMTRGILDAARKLDKRRLQLLLTFARFLVHENQENLQSILNPAPYSRTPEPEVSMNRKQEQEYIAELLEELEREWKTMMEEENPFA